VTRVQEEGKVHACIVAWINVNKSQRLENGAAQVSKKRGFCLDRRRNVLLLCK